MAKKKTYSVVGMMGEAVSDIVDAAATGSQLGVLELAAEDEMSPTSFKRKRKVKAARKKTKIATKSKKKTKKGRGIKRPRR